MCDSQPELPHEPAQLVERRFEDLSRLKYRLFTCDLPGGEGRFALILRFSGVYGIGSAGNDDARFMQAITWGAVKAWRPAAVVFDFTELDYQWGDALWGLWAFGWPPPTPDLPVALLISDRCREGLATSPMGRAAGFETLQAALEHLARLAAESRQELDDPDE